MKLCHIKMYRICHMNLFFVVIVSFNFIVTLQLYLFASKNYIKPLILNRN